MDMRAIEKAVIEKLKTVIDPETGADVWRMRLVEDLVISQEGEAQYTFRPSSPLCPIAFSLAQAIKETIATVPGIVSQSIQVQDYVQAELLSQMLNQPE
jgi:metal-sulfur cluster biosynthetic enzyme